MGERGILISAVRYELIAVSRWLGELIVLETMHIVFVILETERCRFR